MFTVKMENGRAVGLVDIMSICSSPTETRHDWKTLERAAEVAQQLTETTGALIGSTFIGTDSGPNVWPRFDVIEAPKVGDEVSEAFNGDYYPCGVITKITKSLKIVETSTGKKFIRRKQSGSWTCAGWGMVRGHISRLNPSF